MRGSCLCGHVTYEATRLDSPIRHCSCATCRKAHAAAFNTSAKVLHAHFRWLSGEDALRYFESSASKRRYFCGRCGTHLIAQRDGSDAVVLRVASLDDDPGAVPDARIWASDAVPWLDFGPQLAVWPEWAPDP